MRVSSPIGELPFEPRRVHRVPGGIELEGVMGAWPARVRIDAADLPALVRSVPAPVAVGLTLVGFGIAARVAWRRLSKRGGPRVREL
jgi:hypothetical protein